MGLSIRSSFAHQRPPTVASSLLVPMEQLDRAYRLVQEFRSRAGQVAAGALLPDAVRLLRHLEPIVLVDEMGTGDSVRSLLERLEVLRGTEPEDLLRTALGEVLIMADPLENELARQLGISHEGVEPPDPDHDLLGLDVSAVSSLFRPPLFLARDSLDPWVEEPAIVTPRGRRVVLKSDWDGNFHLGGPALSIAARGLLPLRNPPRIRFGTDSLYWLLEDRRRGRDVQVEGEESASPAWFPHDFQVPLTDGSVIRIGGEEYRFSYPSSAPVLEPIRLQILRAQTFQDLKDLLAGSPKAPLDALLGLTAFLEGNLEIGRLPRLGGFQDQVHRILLTLQRIAGEEGPPVAIGVRALRGRRVAVPDVDVYRLFRERMARELPDVPREAEALGIFSQLETAVRLSADAQGLIQAVAGSALPDSLVLGIRLAAGLEEASVDLAPYPPWARVALARVAGGLGKEVVPVRLTGLRAELSEEERRTIRNFGFDVPVFRGAPWRRFLVSPAVEEGLAMMRLGSGDTMTVDQIDRWIELLRTQREVADREGLPATRMELAEEPEPGGVIPHVGMAPVRPLSGKMPLLGPDPKWTEDLMAVVWQRGFQIGRDGPVDLWDHHLVRGTPNREEDPYDGAIFLSLKKGEPQEAGEIWISLVQGLYRWLSEASEEEIQLGDMPEAAGVLDASGAPEQSSPPIPVQLKMAIRDDDFSGPKSAVLYFHLRDFGRVHRAVASFFDDHEAWFEWQPLPFSAPLVNPQGRRMQGVQLGQGVWDPDSPQGFSPLRRKAVRDAAHLARLLVGKEYPLTWAEFQQIAAFFLRQRDVDLTRPAFLSTEALLRLAEPYPTVLGAVQTPQGRA